MSQWKYEAISTFYKDIINAAVNPEDAEQTWHFGGRSLSQVQSHFQLLQHAPTWSYRPTRVSEYFPNLRRILGLLPVRSKYGIRVVRSFLYFWVSNFKHLCLSKRSARSVLKECVACIWWLRHMRIFLRFSVFRSFLRVLRRQTPT